VTRKTGSITTKEESVMKKVDFSGQHIYVGMDIGKKSWKVCIQRSWNMD